MQPSVCQDNNRIKNPFPFPAAGIFMRSHCCSVPPPSSGMSLSLSSPVAPGSPPVTVSLTSTKVQSSRVGPFSTLQKMGPCLGFRGWGRIDFVPVNFKILFV
ncbi:unnamed protein product [Lepidochelys olivacea]